MSRWLVCVVIGTIVMRAPVVVSGAPSEPPPASTATTTIAAAPPDTVATSENVFLPDEENLSECVSALPPPTCGSESRGGWRQTLVIVAIGLGVAFIAWRIVRSVRPKGAP